MIQSGYAGPRRSLVDRAVAAARLDSGAFEEVEADKSATGQAAVVVVVSAVAQGIASYGEGTTAIIASLVAAFVAWLVWAFVTYIIGTALFKGTADMGEMLRTLGFAQAPGALYVLGIIPLLGWLVRLVVAVWILIAGVIAIRQALDISTGKAVITAFVGWLCLLIPMAIFGGMLGMLT